MEDYLITPPKEVYRVYPNIQSTVYSRRLVGLEFGNMLKVIRKFFLNHNKCFRWHLGDYEKHNFFPFEGL